MKKISSAKGLLEKHFETISPIGARIFLMILAWQLGMMRESVLGGPA
jgi:hypothetical protein